MVVVGEVVVVVYWCCEGSQSSGDADDEGDDVAEAQHWRY